MCELAVDTVVRYEALVLPYLDFVRQHRGRRTTDQLENALGRFVQWMTTTGGLTELHQLTPVVLREDLSSLHHFRRATIAVHASALRGWLGISGCKDSWRSISRQPSCFHASPRSTRLHPCGTDRQWRGC